MENLKNLKVAIIADWLTSRGGAEKVILDILKVFPQAEIFTSLYNSKLFPEFQNNKVHTSFIQKIPGAKNHHQLFITLMPLAFESFDLSSFDLVISSNVACSKGVITKPSTLHVSYCHTPTRFAWDDSHNYIKNFPLPKILKSLGQKQLHKYRIWDQAASQRVDKFLTNSNFVKKRILKYYKQNADVIYPGIETAQLKSTKKLPHSNFYVALGRLISYKRFDLIVETFNKSNKTLIIIGEGNNRKKLEKLNTNSNTHFLGYISKDLKNQYLKQAKALIFPQIEDFGLTPLEAQNFGTPVIAFDKGGAKETVIDQKTGLFFPEQTTSSLQEAIDKFEKLNLDTTEITQHASNFSSQNFQKTLAKKISELYEQHKKTFS